MPPKKNNIKQEKITDGDDIKKIIEEISEPVKTQEEIKEEIKEEKHRCKQEQPKSPIIFKINSKVEDLPKPKIVKSQHKNLDNIIIKKSISNIGSIGEKLIGYYTPLKIYSLTDKLLNDEFFIEMLTELMGEFDSYDMIPLHYRLFIYTIIMASQVHIANSRNELTENFINEKKPDEKLNKLQQDFIDI
jgi:hypothetical protein